MFGSEAPGRCDIVGQLVAELCTGLDPNTIGLADVPNVFDRLVAMRKHLDGAIVRMTARYEDAGAWKRSGAKDFEDDLARKTGTSKTSAKKTARTSRRLKKCPKTDQALRDGKLSGDQADAVTSGADASPHDEDDLLASAANEPLHATRDKAARARAKADTDREARQRRQHALRGLRRWTDEDGMCNHLLRTTPEVGAEIDATLKPLIDRAFADARDAGRFESYEAYAADVVSDLLRGRRTTPSTAGHDPEASPDTETEDETGDEERLPERSKTQAVRPDRKVIAFIDVAALNRAVTAHQRTALEARGYRCEVEGCGSTHHLDIDHVTGWTLTKTTRLDDLSWLCRHHHDRKTLEKLWLIGPPGRRKLVKPPDNAGQPDDPGPQQFRLAF